MPATAAAPDPALIKFAEDLRSTYRAAIPRTGSPDPVAEMRSLNIRAAGPARDIPVRVYVPQGCDAMTKLPIVLFVHGGGFVSGDFETHDVLARAIANGTGALAVAVDYRLAPEHPYPAGLDDVYATLSWLAEHGDQMGGDSRALIVCGDSAGANLATEAAMLARDRRGPKIAAQWLMYPTVSNKMDTASWRLLGHTNFLTREVMASVIASYVPSGMSPTSPEVAPLWSMHKGLPPAFIQVGELDPLRDENVDYATALRNAGVEASVKVYRGQQHGFIQFYKDKQNHAEGETALGDGIGFVRRVLAVIDRS